MVARPAIEDIGPAGLVSPAGQRTRPVRALGEYSDHRIAEVLSRADRTNLRTHTDALAEYSFATHPKRRPGGTELGRRIRRAGIRQRCPVPLLINANTLARLDEGLVLIYVYENMEHKFAFSSALRVRRLAVSSMVALSTLVDVTWDVGSCRRTTAGGGMLQFSQRPETAPFSLSYAVNRT